MKKIFTLAFIVLTAVSFAQRNQQRTNSAFASGNLVVVRIGDGTAPTSGSGYTVNLDEYTTSGTLVQSIALPSGATGNRLVLTTSSTSEGALSLSPHSTYLVLGGYDAQNATASVITTATNAGRVIARVDASGNADLSTKVPQASLYANGNLRGATTYDGSGFWTSGTGSAANGTEYISFGGSTATQVSSTVTNTRVVNIFRDQLYLSTASGTFQGVASVGSGMPTTTGQTTTLLPGFPTASGPSPYGFSMNPAGDMMYVADDRATASGGGVQKWTLSGGTWSLVYTLNTGLPGGCRGLCVNWFSPNPTIYATTSSNTLVSVVDAGSSSSFTTLATAASNYVFRGLAFTPGTPLPLNLLSFNGGLNNSVVNLNWATANEVSTSGFEIQRSANGKEFSTISFVNAKGSIATNNYSLVDEKAIAGTNYYRLKMTDKDGSFIYSQIVTVKTKSIGIGVYPNPVKSEFTIQHEGAVKGATVSVVNFEGKQVLIVNVQAGATQTSLDAAKLAPGTYMVIYNNNGERLTKQFVKQ